MTSAVLISSSEARGADIRASLGDTGLTIYRQYSSTSAFLAALPTMSDEIDLIVIDQDVEPITAWDLAREISMRFPALPTAVVLDSPTQADYARAMDANIRSVIAYPLEFEDVQRKVQSALAWAKTVRTVVFDRSAEGSAPSKAGRMITLSGSKGGVGVSTLATHLARQAAKADPSKAIVLVDFDLQKPDLSIVLNVPQSRTVTDILGVVEELSRQQVQDVLYTSPEGFSVFFGPKNGEESELVTELATRKIFGLLRSHFDLVIVDTGCHLNEANSAAIEMADDAYIVATSDVLSLRGSHRLAQLWKRLGIRPTDSSKVILNKVDKKQDLQPEAAKKVVGLPVIPQYIPESISAIELAMNHRDPSLVTPLWSTRIKRLGAEMGILPEEQLSVAPRPNKPKGGKPRKRNRKERGQSTLEFAGIFVLFIFIALVGFQSVLLGMTWIYASGAANEGARAAAVNESAVSAAENHTPVAWRKNMSVTESPDTVHVSIKTPTIVKMSEDFAFTINTSAGIVREK